MGSAGDSPAPVGDPPTGTAQIHVANRPFSLPRTVVSVPSGGSPDGTGGSPVLPGNQFPNTLQALNSRSTPLEQAQASGSPIQFLTGLHCLPVIHSHPTHD